MTDIPLEPLMPGNRFYDPPADLHASEVQMIGGALISALMADGKALGEMLRTMKTMDYSDAEIAGAREREVGLLRLKYRLMCRFVPSPFPLSFYLQVLDTDVQV